VGISRRGFDRSVTLTTRYDGPKVAVACRAGEIEQVLVNLLLNARDAVQAAGRERGHVRVHVKADGCELPALAPEDVRPAATIEISDDGVGMSEEVRSRAFEPFFTTKPIGRGTGLGLTTSYAIVRDHQGTLTCRSVPGAGTTFTVTLPLAHEPLPASAKHAREPHARGLCALIVDDEGAVRAAVGEVLAEAGLRVLGAGGGAEALALLAQHSEVDVVLLDRSMPGGAGETFVPRMREIAPRARILFFTGQMLEPQIAALADGVVHKPVENSELLAVIRGVTGRIVRADV
jgi:CheY-like chemotaxis protein